MCLKLGLHTLSGKSHANNIHVLFFFCYNDIKRKGTMTNTEDLMKERESCPHAF